jgi:hypothetical protein
MRALLFVVITSLWMSQCVFAAPQPDVTADSPALFQYELQVITAKPGKLPDLHAWFRAHQDDVLAKHGATNIAYLVPVGENLENTLLAIYRYSSLPAVLASSRAIKADPLWKPLDASKEDAGSLVEKAESMALTPMYYSPDFKPTKSAEPRVFELRTYTCPSMDHLAFLHARFRDHTMKLFEKYGMENLIYWKPRDIKDSERKLIYLLGHESVAAAKESFAGFRKDPDWLAAKEASEKNAGGSLTEKESGVVSEFFVGTEYSPLR